MSRQWVIVLALAALFGLSLIWLLNQPVPDDEMAGGDLMLPALNASVNQIQAFDIVAPGGAVAVSLRRVGDVDQPDSMRWRVVQRDGYEADFARVFSLLRDLADVQQAEPRTANSEWHARLGLQEMGQSEASGRRLDFPLNEVPSILFGQVDPTGQGSYARLQNNDQSWLLDRVIELPIDPVRWLEPGIMDIPSSDISEVIVRHADGEIVHVQNAGTEQDDFVLLDVPEDREAGPAFRRTALANGLRGLNLEDVRAFDPSLVPESATRAMFTTEDGLDFVVTLFAEGAENESIDSEAPAGSAWWVHFSVSAASEPDMDPAMTADEDPASSALAADAPADNAAANVSDDSASEAEANERLVNAVAVDARLSPWLFRISERKYNEMSVRMDDLLEPLPETEEAPVP